MKGKKTNKWRATERAQFLIDYFFEPVNFSISGKFASAYV